MISRLVDKNQKRHKVQLGVSATTGTLFPAKTTGQQRSKPLFHNGVDPFNLLLSDSRLAHQQPWCVITTYPFPILRGNERAVGRMRAHLHDSDSAIESFERKVL
jgi:hypothetical protein